MATALLTPDLTSEILESYADLLRVGRLTVNGIVIRWRVDGNTPRALDCFLTSFKARVDMIAPDLSDFGMFAYGVLKALSINFALYEVTEYLRKDIGTEGMITILTYDSSSRKQCLEFAVELSYIKSRRQADFASSSIRLPIPSSPDTSGWMVSVAIDFLMRDNILQCDKKGRRKVRGTMNTISTACPHPAPKDFRPSYSVECNLKRKWLRRHFFSKDNVQKHQVITTNQLAAPSSPREGATSSQPIPLSKQDEEANIRRSRFWNSLNPFRRHRELDLTAGIQKQVLGELKIDIMHAQGLQSVATCNPFIISTLMNHQRTTQVLKATNDPIWNSHAIFAITRQNRKGCLDMTVWNQDDASPKDDLAENSEFLGQAMINIEKCMHYAVPKVYDIHFSISEKDVV